MGINNGKPMDEKIQTELTNKLNTVVDDIFLALSFGHISHDSNIFFAACEAKKRLKDINENNFSKNQTVVFKNDGIQFQKVLHSEIFSQPKMLSNCLKVIAYMKTGGFNFANSSNKVAAEKGVNAPTVRQSCCRALGLNAYQWNLFFKGGSVEKENIIKALISKYPEYKVEITKAFN